MDTSIFSAILEEYNLLLSLYAFAGVVAVTLAGKYLLLLVPAVRHNRKLNKEAAAQRATRSYYQPIQNRSKIWGVLTQAAIFLLILPFCLTLEAQPWWKILLNIFIILMFYDFFYYLTHRFVFHDGGPLQWVHAVHHQQKNPCRMDSSYLHPIETCLGLGLYGLSIAVLTLLMGEFHVLTIIITFVAFSEINQHNHDLWETDRFPFKYLNYMAYMHHVHHKRFSAGNYATISLLYDWLFGTYDKGDGFRKQQQQ